MGFCGVRTRAKPTRIVANFDVFDLALKEDEVAFICALDAGVFPDLERIDTMRITRTIQE